MMHAGSYPYPQQVPDVCSVWLFWQSGMGKSTYWIRGLGKRIGSESLMRGRRHGMASSGLNGAVFFIACPSPLVHLSSLALHPCYPVYHCSSCRTASEEENPTV